MKLATSRRNARAARLAKQAHSDTIFNAGAAAFKAGLTLFDNPYGTDDDCEDWIEGWNDAAADADELPPLKSFNQD